MTATHRCPCCGAPRLPLIDLVRGALELEPDAPLGRVQWLVGSRDTSMVATMVRMVRLAAARATVQAPTQPVNLPAGTCPRAPRGLPGSLRVSSSGARAGGR